MIMDVLTIQDFKRKYGTKGLGLMVGEFIVRSPEFPKAMELAVAIGEMMGDLESALKDVK